MNPKEFPKWGLKQKSFTYTSKNQTRNQKKTTTISIATKKGTGNTKSKNQPTTKAKAPATPKRTTNFKKIVQVVSNLYDLNEKELLSPVRRKEIVKPRQVAMYLLREELKESYPAIGRRFGGKDHTTVIYAWEKIAKELKSNDNLLTEINLIRQRLYGEF